MKRNCMILEQDLDSLIQMEMPLQWKKNAVTKWIDGYVRETGRRPDSFTLSKLANYLLKEDLKDRHPDKVSRTEYAILSRDQLVVRERREKGIEYIERLSPANKYPNSNRRKRYVNVKEY